MTRVLGVKQMQHLQRLGLDVKLYSTTFCYIKYDDSDWLLKTTSDLRFIGVSYEGVPTYDVDELLDIIPKTIEVGKTEYTLSIHPINGEWAVDYCSETDADIQSKPCEQIIDAAYSRLCWCIENGYVKENKQREYAMNTDVSYCNGFLSNKYLCPLRDKCRRHLDAVAGDPLWWTEAAFDGEQCRNFLKRE